MKFRNLLFAAVAVCALLCFALPASAAIALVQIAKTPVNTTATTFSVTLNGVASGDFLVATFSTNGVQTFSSIADSSGNSVSTAVAYTTSGAHAGLGIFYVQNTASGAHTITVTLASGIYGELFVAEYSGVATTGALDVASAVGFGASASVASGSISPTANGELVIFGIGQETAAAAFSAYTNGLVQQDSAAGSPSAAWAAVVQSSAAAISGGATSNSTAGWAAAVAAFRPSGASGGPPAGHLPSWMSDTGQAVPELITATSAISVTPDCSYDVVKVTASAAGPFTINAPACPQMGIPTDGQQLVLKIISPAGGTLTYSWNAAYMASATLALPATSNAASKEDYFIFRYDWDKGEWVLLNDVSGV